MSGVNIEVVCQCGASGDQSLLHCMDHVIDFGCDLSGFKVLLSSVLYLLDLSMDCDSPVEKIRLA